MSPSRKNFIANTISLIIRTIIVILIIPFYIKFLGSELYSDWILLYSFPAIFELANFGINQAVNNTFSIYFNQKKDNPQRLITHGIYFTLFMGLLMILSLNILWDFTGVYDFLNFSIVSNVESKKIILFLTLKVFLEMIKGSLCSFLFAKNLNYIIIIVNTVQYIVEIILIVVLILLNKTLVTVSLFFIIPVMLSCVLIYIYNFIKFNFQIFEKLDIRYLKILFKPSYSFSFLSISEYILNQGFIIIFKKYYDPQQLIIFNSAKTLTNYIKQAQGVVASSVYPVFNVYFGENKIRELQKLFRKSFLITLLGSLFLCIALLFFGDLIWRIWIGNSLEFNPIILNLLILIQLIGSFWIISSNLIISINRHFTLANIYIISALSSVLVFYFYNSNFDVAFEYAPLFYLIFHLPMLAYSSLKVKSFFK